MPKTATRQKADDKRTRIADQGGDENKVKNSTDAAVTEDYDLKEAQAEYNKRKKSQLAAIKKLDKALLREMLYQMVLGRLFERKCAEVYRMGKIGGFCHLYIGQEAIAVGTMMALKEGDYVLTSYRDHVSCRWAPRLIQNLSFVIMPLISRTCPRARGGYIWWSSSI